MSVSRRPGERLVWGLHIPPPRSYYISDEDKNPKPWLAGWGPHIGFKGQSSNIRRARNIRRGRGKHPKLWATLCIVYPPPVSYNSCPTRQSECLRPETSCSPTREGGMKQLVRRCSCTLTWQTNYHTLHCK